MGSYLIVLLSVNSFFFDLTNHNSIDSHLGGVLSVNVVTHDFPSPYSLS